MRFAALCALAACSGDPAPSSPSADTGPTAADLAALVLTRASLDTRGVRPSLDELEAVRADPAGLDASIDTFLDDDRLRDRVVSLYGEVYNTVGDETQVEAAEVGLPSETAWARAVGEEPLRILAEVAATDQPWTTIVTADWTMVDDQLAQVWPVAAEAGSGWRRATYTDGRPPAGVLSTNGLWWATETSRNNADRARANQVSRVLLCRDYLDAEVVFDRDVDLSDPEVVQDAIEHNPGCTSCHSSLDPLAAALGGFFVPRKSGLEEFLYYHPEREDIWRTLTGAAPAYAGAPVDTVSELGAAIAADPRFVDCAVEQAATLLLRRAPDLGDIDRLNGYREAFLDSDLSLRALWRAVMASPAYRSVHPDDPRVLDRKLVSPDLLASQLEDLTGFRLTAEGVDLLRNADIGLRALAGGGDGRFATGVTQDPTATLWMVQEQLAQGAAWHVVHTASDRLPDLDPAATPADLDADLERVHTRFLSRAPTPDEVAGLAAHWQQVSDATDPETAWTSVITVLLSDPALLVY